MIVIITGISVLYKVCGMLLILPYKSGRKDYNSILRCQLNATSSLQKILMITIFRSPCSYRKGLL
ncbi:MAG: hypothetical protein JWR72_2503 [Flavisolibacter sp.]|jgi:hypothetical protein|nr:hypothetical protein [Flavisolibacter sp.]